MTIACTFHVAWQKSHVSETLHFSSSGMCVWLHTDGESRVLGVFW